MYILMQVDYFINCYNLTSTCNCKVYVHGHGRPLSVIRICQPHDSPLTSYSILQPFFKYVCMVVSVVHGYED